jgi:F420-non-reducing hydrogenase small subunit
VGKLTFAFVPLSGCGGCEVQVLRAFTLHPELQEMYDIVYWPMVVEATELPEKVDVVMVEGLVRTKENLEMLRKARFAASKLIVVGSCASWGGIGGAADAISAKASMRAIYGREKIDEAEAPEVLPRVFAPADLVPVDYIISRCPPPVEHIVVTLKAVAKNKPVPTATSTVCSQCPRKIKPIEKLEFKPGLPGPDADPETCFLSQGYLCLGSVTTVGCGAPCPRHGIPCFGCGGPYYEIAQRRDMDIVTALARRIATLAGLDPVKDLDKVVKKLLEVFNPRRFYVFTLGSEVLRGKPQGFAVQAIAQTRRDPRILELLKKREEFVRSGNVD